MELTSDTIAHFESIGPSGVKREMAEGKHGQAPDSPFWRRAELWVEWELIRQALVADAKRDAREERTLAITESALEIAKASAESARTSVASAERQATWARWAAIIAMIAAISATSVQISELIAWLQR